MALDKKNIIRIQIKHRNGSGYYDKFSIFVPPSLTYKYKNMATETGYKEVGKSHLA